MATLLGADITPEEKQQLAPVGYSIEGEHSATCVLVDQDVRHIAVNDPDVEILPLKDALTRYDWVQDLMFKLINPTENEHVAQAAESRSEEHTSELQSLMRISYAIFCLKKKNE